MEWYRGLVAGTTGGLFGYQPYGYCGIGETMWFLTMEELILTSSLITSFCVLGGGGKLEEGNSRHHFLNGSPNHYYVCEGSNMFIVDTV